MNEEDIKHSYKKFEYVNWKQKPAINFGISINQTKINCGVENVEVTSEQELKLIELKQVGLIQLNYVANVTQLGFISIKQVPYSRLVWCSLIPLMLLGWDFIGAICPWSNISTFASLADGRPIRKAFLYKQF